MSYRVKEQFFYEMSVSIKSGRTFNQALNRRAESGSVALRKIARSMLARGGDTATSFFETHCSKFSQLDIEIIRVGETSGELDETMSQLSQYYAVMAATKRRMIGSLAYPMFTLHFGALILSSPLLVNGKIQEFWESVFQILGVFYITTISVSGILLLLLNSAKTSPAMSRVVRLIPVVGKLWVSLSATRFCLTLGILVKSGCGILGSIEKAGRASQSGLIYEGCLLAIKKIKAGGTLADSLIKTKAFPPEINSAFISGEETGNLDSEMTRLAKYYEEDSNIRLNTISKWLPQLVSIAVMIALGFRIIKSAQSYYDTLESFIK